MEINRRFTAFKEFIKLMDFMESRKGPKTKGLIILKNAGAYPELIIDTAFETAMQLGSEEEVKR